MITTPICKRRGKLPPGKTSLAEQNKKPGKVAGEGQRARGRGRRKGKGFERSKIFYCHEGKTTGRCAFVRGSHTVVLWIQETKKENAAGVDRPRGKRSQFRPQVCSVLGKACKRSGKQKGARERARRPTGERCAKKKRGVNTLLVWGDEGVNSS